MTDNMTIPTTDNMNKLMTDNIIISTTDHMNISLTDKINISMTDIDIWKTDNVNILRIAQLLSKGVNRNKEYTNSHQVFDHIVVSVFSDLSPPGLYSQQWESTDVAV